MKNLFVLSAAGLIAVGLASCSSQQSVAKHNDDGIYASHNNTETASASAPSNTNVPATSNQPNNQPQANDYAAVPDSGKNQNNYYSDDYSDYDYSSQIKRYDQDWGGNWGYYDDVYTNSYYYSYDPYQYGMSIYLGSPWWGYPYSCYAFAPSFCWGLGSPWWGCGFGYGWGYPYGGYGWGGYGFGNYYYNSYETTSGVGSFPGPRTVKSTSSFGISRSTTAGEAKTTSFGEMYQQSIHSQAATNSKGFLTSTSSMKNGSSIAASNSVLHVAPGSSSTRTSAVSNVATETKAPSSSTMMKSAGNNFSNVSKGSSISANAGGRASTGSNYSRVSNTNYQRSNTGTNYRSYSNSNYSRNNGYNASNRSSNRQSSNYSNSQRVYSRSSGSSQRSYNSAYRGGGYSHSNSSYGSGHSGGYSGGGHSGGSSFGGGHSGGGGGGGGHSGGGGGRR